MLAKEWRQRMLSSTRGKVLALLRRGPSTVSELAGSVGLTDNGVRTHLAALERDGLVRQEGSRPTGGKPSYVYELTPDAEALFPKGYASVLSEVIGYVREAQGDEGLHAFLRAVAHRAARKLPDGKGDLHARVEAAAAVLNELGGLAEVVEDAQAIQIRGYSCPLSSVVQENPETCALAEELVREITGSPARECCDRSGSTPRCAFSISK